MWKTTAAKFWPAKVQNLGTLLCADIFGRCRTYNIKLELFLIAYISTKYLHVSKHTFMVFNCSHILLIFLRTERYKH
jgi:hypothetical protein